MLSCSQLGLHHRVFPAPGYYESTDFYRGFFRHLVTPYIDTFDDIVYLVFPEIDTFNDISYLVFT